jgi:hypothetical protein
MSNNKKYIGKIRSDRRYINRIILTIGEEEFERQLSAFSNRIRVIKNPLKTKNITKKGSLTNGINVSHISPSEINETGKTWLKRSLDPNTPTTVYKKVPRRGSSQRGKD